MPACRTALSTDSNVLTSCGLGKCARAWSEARACRWALVAFRSPAGGVVVAGSDPSQLCCSWAHSLEVHGFGSSRNSNCGCSLYGTHPSPHTADKSAARAFASTSRRESGRASLSTYVDALTPCFSLLDVLRQQVSAPWVSCRRQADAVQQRMAMHSASTSVLTLRAKGLRCDQPVCNPRTAIARIADMSVQQLWQA